MNPILANLAAIKYIASGGGLNNLIGLIIRLILLGFFIFLGYKYIYLPIKSLYLDAKLSFYDTVKLPIDLKSNLPVVNMSKIVNLKDPKVIKTLRERYFILTGGTHVKLEYLNVKGLENGEDNFEIVTEEAFVGESCLNKILERTNIYKSLINNSKSKIDPYFSRIGNQYNFNKKPNIKINQDIEKLIPRFCKESEYSGYDFDTSDINDRNFYDYLPEFTFTVECNSIENEFIKSENSECVVYHRQGAIYFLDKYGDFEKKPYPFNETEVNNVGLNTADRSVIYNLTYVTSAEYKSSYEKQAYTSEPAQVITASPVVDDLILKTTTDERGFDSTQPNVSTSEEIKVEEHSEEDANSQSVTNTAPAIACSSAEKAMNQCNNY